MSGNFISGFAIQWNQPAVIGGLFEERFARGAFDASMKSNDVVALWAHDTSRPLGRTSNGTLKLRSNAIGLWFEIQANSDSPAGQEAIATVGRADVTEVSVGFSSVEEEWSDSYDIPRRLITRADLREVSLVVWGAYGKSTSAALRHADRKSALIEKIKEQHRKRGIK